MRPLPARHTRWLLIAPLRQATQWALALMLGGATLLAFWQIGGASEARAVQATVTNLAHGLNALAAEHMARGQPLEADWARRNPFALLRGQQGNYCGELAERQKPRRGCWYFLPQQARVLYRARFGGWRNGGEEGLLAWQLVALPQQPMETAQAVRQVTAVELRAVTDQ